MKKESGQLNDECDAARNSIKQYIDGIACDENDVLSIEVEKAKNGLLPAKDVMDLIDRLLTQDNDKKRLFKSQSRMQTKPSKSSMQIWVRLKQKNKLKKH